jgi:hypothetical protein
MSGTDERDTPQVMYSLTELTGRRKNVERTTVVASFEVNRQRLFIGAAGATVIGVPLAGLIFLVLSWFGLTQFGYLCLLGPILSWAVTVWVVTTRESSGLRLRRYEAMWDRRRSKSSIDRVYVCGSPVVEPRLGLLIPVVIDTPPHLLPGAVKAPVGVAEPAARRGRRARSA